MPCVRNIAAAIGLLASFPTANPADAEWDDGRARSACDAAQSPSLLQAGKMRDGKMELADDTLEREHRQEQRQSSEVLLSSTEGRAHGSLNLEDGLDELLASAGRAGSSGSCVKSGAASGRPGEPLVFIHIPRNAGTSVEMCSHLDPQLPASQRWGNANHQIKGLYRMPRLKNHPGSPACYKQHVPPQYLPDIYKDKETFCVVRDPYSRMVSQFRFLMIHTKWHEQNCTATVMNQALLEHLNKVKRGNPYFGDCHYLPQMAFVYGIDPDSGAAVFKGERERSCKNVLRLEHLSEEFEDLMSKSGYPYQLPETNKAAGTLGPKDCRHLTKEQLSTEVRRLIEDVYAEDFRRLGYQHL